MNPNCTPPWAGLPAIGPLLRTKDAARYLGYSPAQYYEHVKSGDLPPPIKLGRGKNGASAVPQGWLDAVIAARAAESVIG